jgi:uncharacterized protein (DUF2267 family)
MIDHRNLIETVRARSGFRTNGESERAVHAVLSALGDVLGADEVNRLARELPERAAQLVRTGAATARFDRRDFAERVARREGVESSFGLEHAEVVCAALFSALTNETRAHLLRSLDADVASLFTTAERERPTETTVQRAPKDRSTLAEGRPGSRHPVSESKPGGAQTHSVADANPHADTKLSSAKGLTQEDLGETLATGGHRSKRPLSGG